MKLNFEQRNELDKINVKPIMIFADVFDIFGFKFCDNEMLNMGEIIVLTNNELFETVLKLIKYDENYFKKAFNVVIKMKKNVFDNNPQFIGIKEAIEESIKFIKFVYKMKKCH